MVSRADPMAALRFDPVVRLGDGLLVGASLVTVPAAGVPLDRMVSGALAALAGCRDEMPCFSLRVSSPHGLSPASAHLLFDAVAGSKAPSGLLRVVVPEQRLRAPEAPAVARLRAAGVALDVLLTHPAPVRLASLGRAVDGVVMDASLAAAVEGAGSDLAALVLLVEGARRVGLDVHAEGVTSSHQAWVLGSLGCLTGQGPLAGPALTAGQLQRRLAACDPVASASR